MDCSSDPWPWWNLRNNGAEIETETETEIEGEEEKKKIRVEMGMKQEQVLNEEKRRR